MFLSARIINHITFWVVLSLQIIYLQYTRRFAHAASFGVCFTLNHWFIYKSQPIYCGKVIPCQQDMMSFIASMLKFYNYILDSVLSIYTDTLQRHPIIFVRLFVITINLRMRILYLLFGVLRHGWWHSNICSVCSPQRYLWISAE